MFVAWMALSFLVHGVLLGADYAKLTSLFRTPEASQQYFPLMLFAHVLLAGAFTWIYRYGCTAQPWLGQRLRFGLAIVLLTVVPTYMIYFVVQPMPASLAIKQIVFDGIAMLLLALLVAWLHRNAASKKT